MARVAGTPAGVGSHGGSVLGALLWMGASMLFSWYVATFDSYNKTYGSLGAGIGFMVWLWLSAVIVLLGGELNAEMEHQTARDTTDGYSKPLGSRGAMMADHMPSRRQSLELGAAGEDRRRGTTRRRWRLPHQPVFVR